MNAQTNVHRFFLRVVNRVYLTGGVVVTMTNLDSRSAGADVGAAPSVSLPDLTSSNATGVSSSAKAYQDALAALGQPLNS